MSNGFGFKNRWNGQDTYEFCGVEMDRATFRFTCGAFIVVGLVFGATFVFGVAAILSRGTLLP